MKTGGSGGDSSSGSHPMSVYSLAGFAAKLLMIGAEMDAITPAILSAACVMICKKAKDSLGEYQDGWPALQPETIARKITGDSPLLETGELRASIKWNADDHEGYVGSDDMKALYHEFGTSRGIPARPFLGPAALKMEAKIEAMAARAVMAVLLGRGIASSEMRELLELLHAAKELAEKVWDDFGPEDEDKGKRK
jgi:phage gpG-like protein